jgi:subtilase family serine protease
VGSRIGVGWEADFVVTAVTGPASVSRWEFETATVTVCNQGTASGDADVAVYLSTDTIINPEEPPSWSADFSFGYVSTGTLDPGQCETLTVSRSGYFSEGSYSLGAGVDLYNHRPELIEDNNTWVGASISITP